MTAEEVAVDRRVPPPAPWVLDLLLGVGVTLVVSLFIAADIEGSEPDGWAYLWAAGLGGLMLVRRRYPALVVLLSAAAVVTYYVAGYPAIGVAVPLAAAVFSAAEQGRMAVGIVASSAVLALSVVYRIAIGQDASVVVGYDLPGHALLLAAAIALGDSLRARRELRRRSEQIAALRAEKHARAAAQRALAERLAIARELHDSVGHALTVIGLHAQIAEEHLDDRPRDDADDGIRAPLGVIAKTTTTTFDELRRTVAGLRRGDRALHPSPGLSDLAAAVGPAAQAGVAVRTRVDVDPPLPPDVESAVYRIVQESVTNAVRHAAASTIDVVVRQRRGRLDIAIVNDIAPRPRPLPRPGRVGSGITGMRERAALLGGSLTAGPEPGGFAVRATLPLAEPA